MCCSPQPAAVDAAHASLRAFSFAFFFLGLLISIFLFGEKRGKTFSRRENKEKKEKGEKKNSFFTFPFFLISGPPFSLSLHPPPNRDEYGASNWNSTTTCLPANHRPCSAALALCAAASRPSARRQSPSAGRVGENVVDGAAAAARGAARALGALGGDVLLDLLGPVRLRLLSRVEHVFEEQAARRDRGGGSQEAVVEGEGERVGGEGRARGGGRLLPLRLQDGGRGGGGLGRGDARPRAWTSARRARRP